MLEDSALASPKSVPVLLTQHTLADMLPISNHHTICLDTDWHDVALMPSTNPSIAVWEENLVYILYTSGSTGKPKGITMKHGALVNLLRWQAQNTSLTQPGKTLQFASLGFDVSCQEIFSAWSRGGALVLISEDTRRDAYAMLQFLADASVEQIFLPFVALQNLAQAGIDHGIAENIRLQEIITAGEQLQVTPSMKQFFNALPNCALHNQYGPTETHVVTTFTLQGIPDEWTALPPIGRPVANTQIYLLDPHLQPVPIGVPGELYIGGDGLARGYLNRPDLTAEKFIPNPFSVEPGARIYRTGDLARWLPDGNIEYLGRVDQQVKIRGFRVELGEIEAALGQHPEVQENAVLAREDTPGNKRLVAYMVLHNTKKNDAGELRQYLKGKLPEYMLPSAFVLLEALPLTRNGKVDRKALPAPDDSLITGSHHVAPRTPTEEVLSDIWANVLKLERIGIHDNFFDLGGHSLLATQIVSRLRQTFQVELSVRNLFEAPTLAELAGVIENARDDESHHHTISIEPVSREESIPLSFAQQRLWFLDQYESGSITYNIPAALRLQGRLNHSALKRAFAEIIHRHEVLRTVFVTVNDEPIQQILPNLPFALPIVDLSAAPSEQQADQIKQLAMQHAGQPFDLSRGPLLRASLLQLNHDDHILLLNMHHIISDGWSIETLNYELSSIYAAYVANQPSPLPELPIQYADFSAWQRKWLQGETLEKQLAYWKQQLAHSPALLELPADHPRPAKQTFHGHSLTFHIDTALTQNLKTLSRQKNTTLFMTLYAAFAVLLSRYSRQDDLAIGSPVANRSRPELEQLIGFFVNTLALRADLSNNLTFTQLLNQVRQTTLDAYAHQDIPFEKLVEQLHPERSLSHSPIFQVMFALQNAPAEKLEMPGLDISSVAFENNTAKFDLTLEIEETEKSLTGSFEYNTDLFDQATIQRMIGHWQTLLAGIAANPEQKVAEIPIITEVERQQILTQWNDTRAEFPQRKCIHQMFEEQAKRAPDSIAVVFENQSLTYRELNKRANQLARFLQKRGVGADVLVGICVERSIEMIVGLLGILKAGGAYVPIDPDYPAERITFILEDIQSPVFLTQRHVLNRLSTLEERAICLDQAWINIAQEDPENLDARLADDNLAYVIYTSGSTGQPKGVQIEHQMLRNLIGWHQQSFSVTATDQATQIAGAAFDASAWEVWPCLVSGACLHIADEKTRLSPVALRDWLISQRITISFLPTPLAEAILELDWPAETPLRILLTGGDKLHTHPRPTLPFTLVNNYGPTENTVVTTSAIVPPQKETAPAPSIGVPIKNTQVYVLDGHLQLVPAGIAGELYVAGLGLARGYLNRSDLTAEKFLPNPFSAEPGARMYRTGDLARWLPDGRIEFLGRIDHQVKIRGFRIELGEIESALDQHPDVQEAVVLAREDSPGDKRLIAYVVLHNEKTLDVNELRAHLKGKLPDYMLPSTFIQLAVLPLSPNGKLDRKVLPAPDRNLATSDYIAPRTPTEEALAGIWAEVLKLERIGIHDNFFDLGGHSLLATQVISRLRQVLQVELPVRSLFEYSTVAQMSLQIDIWKTKNTLTTAIIQDSDFLEGEL